MKKFVLDASAVLHLASAGVDVPRAHELLAPTLLRSQTLSALHEAVQRSDLPADVARDRLRRIGRMGLPYDAEYVALTQLQADAFITLDANLARRVRPIVAVTSIDALLRARAR